MALMTVQTGAFGLAGEQYICEISREMELTFNTQDSDRFRNIVRIVMVTPLQDVIGVDNLDNGYATISEISGVNFPGMTQSLQLSGNNTWGSNAKFVVQRQRLATIKAGGADFQQLEESYFLRGDWTDVPATPATSPILMNADAVTDAMIENVSIDMVTRLNSNDESSNETYKNCLRVDTLTRCKNLIALTQINNDYIVKPDLEFRMPGASQKMPINPGLDWREIDDGGMVLMRQTFVPLQDHGSAMVARRDQWKTTGNEQLVT